jgi:hypothetical protein
MVARVQLPGLFSLDVPHLGRGLAPHVAYDVTGLPFAHARPRMIGTPPENAMPLPSGGRAAAQRFPITFEPWYRIVSTVVGLPPSGAYVAVGQGSVEVRMGWAFRSRFPISAIESVSRLATRPVSRGVHGFRGRWLVNGSGAGILVLRLTPTQRGYVLGVPVRLRELLVSVDEPAELAAALGKRA